MEAATKRKFERHFEGRSNAGLRKTIRDTVGGHRCGPAIEKDVMSLRYTVALTASGLCTLAMVAADYRAVHAEHKYTCDCNDCYEVNLAALRR
jgi:hypothetical protein